jgi:hypothetical protein
MKRRIRILFYRARIGDKKWLDDAISLWTGIFNWGTGPYSHVELQVPDENGLFEDYLTECSDASYHGDCYTSTMRGDAKGVCKRPASEILKNPKRWDYCEIEIPDSLFEGGINYIMARIGQKIKYAFRTIASFFLPVRIHSKLEDICSELIYDVLVIWHIFKKKNKCPSPRRLSRWLTKRGYVIKPLVAE